MLPLSLANESLQLLPEAALFWEAPRILFLADLHLGKAAHFRKNGIPIPGNVQGANLERFRQLVEKTQPERVIFLGDLFHSRLNQAWEAFVEVLDQFPAVSFELVQGNHDILPKSAYEDAHLVIHQGDLDLKPFLLRHFPMDVENLPLDRYVLAGHVHPGIRLQGAGRQRLRLPCFYFTDRQGILPAFGAFTGLGLIEPKKEDRVFVLAEGEVFQV
ncbi:MAG: ligase-associated DNA damage response endonuclease PdeM [Bacteroidota bacterium]